MIKFLKKTIISKKNPTIYLHIGMNKTGSTSIQDFLFKNRETFISYGFLYPSVGLINNAHYHISNILGFSHSKEEIMIKDSIKLSKEFHKEISKLKPSKIFISSEMFILDKDVSKVKDFFKGYEVKIVVFLRRHDYWWESAYKQSLKMQVNPPWKAGIYSFLNFHNGKKYGNYRYLLDKWANKFGEENIIVIPFEKQQNEPSIIETLLTKIGEEDLYEKRTYNSEIQNIALSDLSCRLLEVYQRIDIHDDIRSKLIKYIFSLESKKKHSFISPEKRNKLIDKNLNDYEYIAEKYLTRKNKKLYYDPLPKINEEYTPPSRLKNEEVAYHTIKAMTI